MSKAQPEGGPKTKQVTIFLPVKMKYAIRDLADTHGVSLAEMGRTFLQVGMKQLSPDERYGGLSAEMPGDSRESLQAGIYVSPQMKRSIRNIADDHATSQSEIGRRLLMVGMSTLLSDEQWRELFAEVAERYGDLFMEVANE